MPGFETITYAHISRWRRQIPELEVRAGEKLFSSTSIATSIATSSSSSSSSPPHFGQIHEAAAAAAAAAVPPLELQMALSSLQMQMQMQQLPPSLHATLPPTSTVDFSLLHLFPHLSFPMHPTLSGSNSSCQTSRSS
jgi:hypothetical protein